MSGGMREGEPDERHLILGVDPGLNRCGWGLVFSEGARLSHAAHGVITPSPKQQLASRLHDVFGGADRGDGSISPAGSGGGGNLRQLNARRWSWPTRGVALAAAARTGLMVAEYAPDDQERWWAQARRINPDPFMVRRLLPTAGDERRCGRCPGVALCRRAWLSPAWGLGPEYCRI